ncbi:MAG: hypothetical protein H6706_30985 [Myxococcales bacterium]|nr:hypothetical protein [Myxococcales bacterium]
MGPTHTASEPPIGGCPRTASIRALCLTAAPATLAAAPLAGFARLSAWPGAVALALSLALLAAGLGHRVERRWPRWVATGAFLLWVAGGLVAHPEAPARGLALLLAAVGFAAVVWPTEPLRRAALARAPRAPMRDVGLAATVATVFGLERWLAGGVAAFWGALALAAALAVPVGLLAWRLRRHGRLGRAAQGVVALAVALALAPVIVCLAAGPEHEGLALGLGAPLLVGGWLTRDAIVARLASTAGHGDADLLDLVMAQPARVLVLSFVLLGAIGTLLLGLPMASQGAPVAWLDAAFTSVSATCVTGLAVVDTPTTFSSFGLGVILALIQVGGLGIMVFSATMVVLLGRRLSLSHERAAADLVGADGRGDLVSMVGLVLRVTFITEGVAAALLFVAFLAHGDPVGVALWRGVFTAISAFCNAGFALQSDSLVPYAESSVVLGVTGATIIVGGLGPIVVAALWSWRRRRGMTLHVRLVLWTTALLVVVPALAILALEWGGTLGGMTLGDKLGNALFQSVTLRTAGFNSIDLAAIQPATWTLMVLVMFVGGSPGSTAGGAKTTTIAVLVLAIFAVVRGRGRVEVFGRALPTATVMRATAVTTLGVLGSGAALFALQLTQVLPLDQALFEVVSALATVGLSTGATAALDDVGKLIIMACMFAGRVGPLTLFVFLSLRPPGRAAWRYPEESVPIG